MLRSIKINLLLVIKNLHTHKIRTLLSILGIAFGTISLVVVSNITEMMKKKVAIEAEKYGKNLVIVSAGTSLTPGRGRTIFLPAKTLKESDAKEVKLSIPNVMDVSPSFSKSFPLRYKESRVTANAIGISKNYNQLRNIKIYLGRYFIDSEFDNNEKKVILGYKIYENLFGKEDPLGKYVLLFRAPLEVVGVLEPMGVDLTGNDQDNQILIPYSTMIRRILNVDYITTFYVQVSDSKFLNQSKEEITKLLRIRHKIQKGQRDDFFVRAITDLVSIKDEATTLVNDLGNTASILSFSIGGLGILAIMMMTVAERKREIGIRRACGATKKDIILQFLLEALFLTISGSILGIFVASLVTLIISHYALYPLAFSVMSIFISIILSFCLGIFAGLYPAKKASDVDPIKALYEV
ncbi:MAG: ABC transporter permease [Proteobacteria bacterium]|nr:ABC transporter permease [Pseudomonadota bacterium]